MSNIFKFEKKLNFPEKYFISPDNKTILGETLFKDTLFLDYRDTEAGSNPREYNGLKKANREIIKSLLKDPKEMFRFLHSGMIVSLTGLNIINGHSISYDDCCLTNGNQTRFIILIISLLKQFSSRSNLENLNQKTFNQFLKREFKNQRQISDFFLLLRFNRVSETYKFLTANTKYFEQFKDLNLKDFLNSKIRITVNVLDKIIESIENLDEYDAGTLIANANNDTQNVKIDDIFGSKHKKDLEKHIFKDFINAYKDSVKIEYRFGEIIERNAKVHILTLLRPVIATGILTKDKDLFKLSNQRTPIYTIFIKLFRNSSKTTKTIETISKIIPLLYSIRETYIAPQLKLQREVCYREYIEKAINEELDDTTIRDRIKIEEGEPAEDTKKAIKSIVNYNIEHIFPVVVFRIRNLIKLNLDGKAVLNIPTDKEEQFFKSIVNSIYKRYIELKLIGTTGSITDSVRNPDFFKGGEEAYEALKNMIQFQEISYIKENRYFIK